MQSKELRHSRCAVSLPNRLSKAPAESLVPVRTCPPLRELAPQPIVRASNTATRAPCVANSRAADKPVHPHDLNATLLHLLGLDHTRLTYRHNGRNQRLTDVAGNVIGKVVA